MICYTSNSAFMTTWIDDHLKRRLHEAVGHLSQENLERTGAKFRQYRHYNSSRNKYILTDSDIQWHKYVYFERLLRGCIAHALIVEPDGTPGLLSREVSNILRHRNPGFKTTSSLKKAMQDRAKNVANDILNIWREADYGDNKKSLNLWVDNVTTMKYNKFLEEFRGIKYVKENYPLVDSKIGIDYICDTITTDMLSYLKLVKLWPDYVNAINDLRPFDAYWLFRTID